MVRKEGQQNKKEGGGGVNLSRDEQSTDVEDLLREALPPWGERRMKATPGSKPCGPPAG